MAKRAQIAALTGLRGIAASLVVIAHYAYWGASFSRASVSPVYNAMFDLSGYGMTLFFILSGFVISYNYLDLPWRDAPTATLYRFVVLRFSRLYPALILFIVDVVLTRRLGPQPGLVTALHAFSVQSWLPFVYENATFPHGPFDVSWSISTEIMLYLLFAAAMILGSRFVGRARHVGCAVCVLCVFGIAGLLLCGERIVVGIATLPPAIEPVSTEAAREWFFYMSPWCRIVDFTWGILVAVFIRQGLHKTCGRIVARTGSLAALTLICLHVWIGFRGEHLFPVHFQFQQFATAPLFALITMAGATAGSTLNRILSARVLVLIGTVSYSLYLFHFLAPSAFGSEPTGTFSTEAMVSTLIRMAAMFALSLAIAATSYIVVEKPAKLLLRRLALPPRANRPNDAPHVLATRSIRR